MGGLPKHKVYLRSSLEPQPKGLAKSHNVYYGEIGLLFLHIYTPSGHGGNERSPRIGVGSIGISPWRLLHHWEPVE